MNTQAQVELAFLCWITGDKEKYQNIITQHQDDILHYQGRGDIYTYFLPVLLFETLWLDTQKTGFPMEKLVSKFPEIMTWIQWDSATSYIYHKNPQCIFKLIEYGLSLEQMEPDLFRSRHENRLIILDYFNSEMREIVEQAMDNYNKMSEQQWEIILDKLEQRFQS